MEQGAVDIVTCLAPTRAMFKPHRLWRDVAEGRLSRSGSETWVRNFKRLLPILLEPQLLAWCK